MGKAILLSILLSILYATLFVAATLAVFVLGAPLFHRAGLTTVVEIAFPIALLVSVVAGISVGFRRERR